MQHSSYEIAGSHYCGKGKSIKQFKSVYFMKHHPLRRDAVNAKYQKIEHKKISTAGAEKLLRPKSKQGKWIRQNAN